MDRPPIKAINTHVKTLKDVKIKKRPNGYRRRPAPKYVGRRVPGIAREMTME
jgi:hypothetical protein